MRRLTRVEYNNTVRDLLGDATGPAATFPPDEEALGFDNNAGALTVSQLHVEQYLAAAEKLVAAAPLATLLTCDPLVAGVDVCGTRFVETFGRRAFRRPLDGGEVTRFKALLDTARTQFDFNTGVRMVAEAMLQSPQFLYRTELGSTGPVGAVVPLTPYEVASRLSYLLWQSMPDEALLTAAGAGRLGTRAEVLAQAKRLLADSRARPTVANFHGQWLQLRRLTAATKDAVLYPGFETLKPLMAREAELFAEDVFWSAGSHAAKLFTAAYTFLNKPLATHYGMTGPTGDAFVKVPLDTSTRAGFLTTAAFLAAKGKPDQSSPVHRGKFVREQLFCQHMPPPPADIVIVVPEVLPGATTRERFAEHSNNPACVGCHHLMDPIGFGFENYDTVGRYRTSDNGLPVDASGEVFSALDADGPFVGAVALSQRLASADIVKSCIATQWFRFGHGRGETTDDACSLQQVKNVFSGSNFSLQELVVALTQSDAFLSRRVVAAAAPTVKLSPALVTASVSETGNLAPNVADGNLATRWAAFGDSQWVKFDLGSKRTVAYTRIAWPYGDVRNDLFEIQVSDDNVTWRQVYTGQSVGTTTQHQVYDFLDDSARWLRVVGHGNTAVGTGAASGPITVTVVKSGTLGAVPGFDPLVNGSTLGKDLGGTELNVRANIASGLSVTSVGFTLYRDGVALHTRTEAAPPFALCGDNAGNYLSCGALLSTNGSYRLVVTPNTGTPYEVTFTVADTGTAVNANPTGDLWNSISELEVYGQ